jgi:ankyrin repeat protein
VNAQDIGGTTPLHLASRNNNLQLVKYLVENGADVCITNRAKASPLHTATILCHLSIVKYLVENKSDILIKDRLL